MVDPTSATDPEIDLAYLPGTSWRVWHAGLVTFIFLLSAVVGVALLTGISGNDFDDLTANQQLGILGPVQFVGGILGLVLVMTLYEKGKGPVEALGLRLKIKDWWAFFAGIGLQIGAAILLLTLAFFLFPDSDPPQQAAAEMTGDLSGWGLVVGFITVAALAPIYEEALFRGIVLSRLVRLMTPWSAYILNGLLFAAIHVVFDPNAWFAALALFPLGTALAWMAHRSGDISRSILAHMGVNTLGAIGLFFGDDLQRWAEELEKNAQTIGAFLGIG
jgi:membrane protease YdiL (CAAX protease family)